MAITTLINNQTVSGTHSSSNVPIPTGLTGRVTFATVIGPTNLLDPSKSINFEIDSSSDGITWQFVAGFTWQGDPNWNTNLNPSTGLPDPGPYISFNMAEILGKQIRARVSIPSPIKLSATVSY